MQSKITTGEMPVALNGVDLVLKPTLRAMTQISRQYGGLGKARSELVAENFDAIVFILRVGTGMSDRDARDLGDRVYANGITAELLVPLIKYVAVLGNGGKPLDDEPVDAPAGDDAEAGAGNF